jgi:hypothetical protein
VAWLAATRTSRFLIIRQEQKSTCQLAEIKPINQTSLAVILSLLKVVSTGIFIQKTEELQGSITNI